MAAIADDVGDTFWLCAGGAGFGITANPQANAVTLRGGGPFFAFREPDEFFLGSMQNAMPFGRRC